MAELSLTIEQTQKLVEAWIKAEQEGEQFPVPFDSAWAIAGYSRRDNAKRSIKNFLEENENYISLKLRKNSLGRTFEDIRLTCDAFKELCMLSRSDTGKTTRKYFIETEKNWKIVEQNFPQIAEDVEKLRLQVLLEQERNRGKALDNTMLALHGSSVVLALRGDKNQIVKEQYLPA